MDVFGAEKQPYISEVFIDWDPTTFKEYIAIELYNPHAVPISLVGMKLVRCGRDTVPPELFEVADLAALDSIGPGERVLVENPGTDIRPADVAAEIPPSTRRIDGPLLTLAITQFRFFRHNQRDLYLMRLRSQTGERTASKGEWDRYDEKTLVPDPKTGKPNFSNFVPIDQVDLTHVVVAPPPEQLTDPQNKNRFRWRVRARHRSFLGPAGEHGMAMRLSRPLPLPRTARIRQLRAVDYL